MYLIIFDKKLHNEVCFLHEKLNFNIHKLIYCFRFKVPIYGSDESRCIIIGKHHSEAMGFDAISSYGINGGGTFEVNRF